MNPEPFLTFRQRIHKTVEEDLQKWRDKDNVIAGGLFTLLKGNESKSEKAALGMDCLGKASLSLEDQTKITALLFRVGKLTEEEERETMATRIKLPEPKIFNELRTEGKLEDIKRMLELNSPWEFITNVTQISQAEYERYIKK